MPPGYCFALPLDSRYKLLGQLPIKELEGAGKFIQHVFMLLLHEGTEEKEFHCIILPHGPW